MEALKKFFKKDNVWFGILIGVIAPLIFYFILTEISRLLSLVLTYGISLLQDENIQLLSVFLNLFIMRTYLLSKDYERTGRGVLLATFILSLAHFYLRWNVY